MIVIFATNHDAATRCSHWIALQSHQRLTAELGLATTILEGDAAQRTTLEQALAGEAQGLAFFGHGNPSSLLDAAKAAVLDVRNINLLRDRWVHAFACRAGTELAGEAAAAGARCFAGYESTLIVEWEPEDIPEPIRGAFVQLVTQTTVELARGIDDLDMLLRASRDTQALIIEWCDEHPGEADGIQILAQQLLMRLVVRRCA